MTGGGAMNGIGNDCSLYGPTGAFTCGPTCDMECMEESGGGTMNGAMNGLNYAQPIADFMRL